MKTKSCLQWVGLFCGIAFPLTLNAASSQILGWNNLGMHCMDSDYSVFSILPPYNTIEAQLIVGGKLITNGSGYSVTYQAVADPDGSFNSTSAGKGNFYDFTAQIYGPVGVDLGLAGWSMPGTNNIPQSMLFENTNHPAAGVATPVNWYRAEGIPLTPYDDAGRKNPYPIMRLIARNPASQIIASNDIVLPVSDEMDCRACHASGTQSAAQPADGWVGDPNPERDYRLNILRLHDQLQFTNYPGLYQAALAARGYNPAGLFQGVVADGKPVLCASCHASEALGTGSYSNIPPLTASVHSLHAHVTDPVLNMTLDSVANRAACYRCHPGSTTKCLRGAMGSAIAADGSMEMQCQSCHGNMSQVGSNTRIGWFMEPNCQGCHSGTATHNNGQIRYTSVFDTTGNERVAVDQTFATTPDTPATGLSLYRFSTGHGGLQCEACHGSTHAEFPASHRNDNIRNIQLQGHAGVMAECTACHTSMPNTISGGPHGMHPIGQSWVSQHHDAVQGNPAQCQACHGLDYRGTVLSRAQGDRQLTASFDGGTVTLQLFRGAQIGCYNCHNGPGGDSINSSAAPTVSNISATTAVDQPVSVTLPSTGANVTLRIVSQPAHGSVGLNGHVATYFPDSGFIGPDTFTFAAFNGSKNSALATGTIGVGTTLDTTPPSVTIISPTSSLTYNATSSSLSLGGTAADNATVASVSWSNDRGGSGLATGTTNWTVGGIILQSGVNVLTVTATDTSGNTASRTLSVTYTTSASISINISGAGTVSPSLNGQTRPLGSSITLTAKPVTGNVFVNWTGSISSSVPTISLTLQTNIVIQANFIPNPFPAVKGIYRGLFQAYDGVTQTNSGALMLTVTSLGNGSGYLQMGASRYLFRGNFDGSGQAIITVPRANQSSLLLNLQLDLSSGSDAVTGTVSDGVWTAELTGVRAVFSATSHTSKAGRYTLVIPGNPGSAMLPGGYGCAIVNVRPAGGVSLNGWLADGTRFNQSSVVSKNGQWPLYIPLSGGQGTLFCWVSFTNAPTEDLNGSLSWIKPALPASLYPGGFATTAALTGSHYQAPPLGTKALNFSNGQFVCGASLNITNQLSLGFNNRITNLSSNTLTLTIVRATGLFRGSVVNPANAQMVSFNGVVLQNQNLGLGYFLNASQSGPVYFGP